MASPIGRPFDFIEQTRRVLAQRTRRVCFVLTCDLCTRAPAKPLDAISQAEALRPDVVAAIAAVYIWRALEPAASALPAPDDWPTARWQSSTPEEQGFDSAKLVHEGRQKEASLLVLTARLTLDEASGGEAGTVSKPGTV